MRGIGIDIEDITRFRKMPFAKNKLFYQKIFTKDEIAYCLGKEDPSQHFAARFCAKEAFVKAFPSNPGGSVKLLAPYTTMEVEIQQAKPVLHYQRKRYLVSLSHDTDKAVAVVIIP